MDRRNTTCQFTFWAACVATVNRCTFSERGEQKGKEQTVYSQQPFKAKRPRSLKFNLKATANLVLFLVHPGNFTSLAYFYSAQKTLCRRLLRSEDLRLQYTIISVVVLWSPPQGTEACHVTGSNLNISKITIVANQRCDFYIDPLYNGSLNRNSPHWFILLQCELLIWKKKKKNQWE